MLYFNSNATFEVVMPFWAFRTYFFVSLSTYLSATGVNTFDKLPFNSRTSILFKESSDFQVVLDAFRSIRHVVEPIRCLVISCVSSIKTLSVSRLVSRLVDVIFSAEISSAAWCGNNDQLVTNTTEADFTVINTLRQF